MKEIEGSGRYVPGVPVLSAGNTDIGVVDLFKDRVSFGSDL